MSNTTVYQAVFQIQQVLFPHLNDPQPRQCLLLLDSNIILVPNRYIDFCNGIFTREVFQEGERSSTGVVRVVTDSNNRERHLQVNKYSPQQFHFYQHEKDSLYQCNKPGNDHVITFNYAIEYKVPVPEDGSTHVHSYYTVTEHFSHNHQRVQDVYQQDQVQLQVQEQDAISFTNIHGIWGINRNRSNDVTTKRVMYQLANGLRYLHQTQHLTHNDLIPEHVAICDQNCKLIHFHTAEFMTGHKINRLDTYHDVLEYLQEFYAPDWRLRDLRGDSFPPEFEADIYTNITPERSYSTSKRDIWCLGIIMLKLYTGGMNLLRLNAQDEAVEAYAQSPWFGLLRIGQFQDYMRGQFPDIDPLGIDLMDRMLQPDAAERITIEQVMNHRYFANL